MAIKKKTDDEWKAEIQQRIQNDCKRDLIAQWKLNAAHYDGEQWADWDRVGKKLKRTSRWHESASMVTANRARGTVEWAVALWIFSGLPNLKAAAASTRPNDKNVARIGDKFVSMCEQDTGRINPHGRMLRIARALYLFGAGGIQTAWDPETRDVMTTFCCPTDIVIPRYPAAGGELPWYLRTVIMDAEWTQDTYKTLIPKEQWILNQDSIEDALRDLNRPGPSQSKPTGVRFKEYWKAANGQYPEGKLIIQAGNHLVHNGINPCPTWEGATGGIPLVLFKGVSLGNSPWGLDLMRDISRMETANNQMLSNLLDGSNIATRPVLIRKYGDFAPHIARDFMGIQIEVVPGREPSYLSPPAMSSYTVQAFEMLERNREEVTSMHSVSRGKAEGQLRSEPPIRALQQRDVQRYAPMMYDIKIGYTNLIRKLLRWAQVYYPPEKIARLTNEAGDFDVVDFGSAHIRGVDDIVMLDENMEPQTLMQKAQRVGALRESGALNPEIRPQDRLTIMRLLGENRLAAQEAGESGEDGLVDDEERRLDQGVPVEVKGHHTHDFHIERHRKRRNRRDFAQIAGMRNPQTRMTPDELYDRHEQTHELMKMIQGGAVSMARQMMQGQMPGEMGNAATTTAGAGAPGGQESLGRGTVLAASAS